MLWNDGRLLPTTDDEVASIFGLNCGGVFFDFGLKIWLRGLDPWYSTSKIIGVTPGPPESFHRTHGAEILKAWHRQRFGCSGVGSSKSRMKRVHSLRSADIVVRRVARSSRLASPIRTSTILPITDASGRKVERVGKREELETAK